MPRKDWDEQDDAEKEEQDRDRLVEELREEFDGDPDSAIDRAEEAGIDIDEIVD